MKYLLLLCGQPRNREAWEKLPDETRAQHYSRVGQWFAEHRSQIRSSNQFYESYTQHPPLRRGTIQRRKT
jgi:hypothetical protein